jgi:hypothetical protein
MHGLLDIAGGNVPCHSTGGEQSMNSSQIRSWKLVCMLLRHVLQTKPQKRVRDKIHVVEMEPHVAQRRFSKGSANPEAPYQLTAHDKKQELELYDRYTLCAA